MQASLKLWCNFALAAIVSVVIAGCSDAGSAAQEESSQAEAMEDGPVRLGLIPSEGGTDIVERFKPVITQLEKELGRPVEAFSATEYLGIITAMKNKQVDVVYFGPKSYVESNRIAGAVAVAKELNLDGLAGYYGIIVTHKDSGIASLADAKGKGFVFTTPNSTSGFLVPSIGIIEETGMSADEYFGEVSYTGTHGNAVRAVLAGDLEVAATNTLDLRAMEQSGLDSSNLVEIWRSPMIPAGLIAVRDDLPESFHRQGADALVALSEDEEAMERMARGGFVPATDADYDIIRVLEQRKAEMAEANGG
ncbi:MAG: phosphate/phosphite/phosphonate ABC transporter substrate-binding protein [Phycisphaerales bacterium]